MRAGGYAAIGYNLQGISQQQLEKTKTTLENAKAKLEKFQATKDQVALQGLTKHDITGAMIQAGVQSYFAINQAQDTIAAKQHGNVIKQPFMSFGSFATYVHPTQRYGIIFGASPKGMQMDIDQIMYQAVSKNNSTEELKGFILSQGPHESANEHLVPEQLFDDPKTKEKEAQGISAVKALQIASSQGQTIYTVTKANYAEVLPKLNHSTDVMTDVRNAINAGKEVTISQKQVHAFGWSGTGYIVLDPESGVGGYLIGGGADGGMINFFGENQNLIVLLLGIAAIASVSLPFLFLPVLLITIFSAFMITMYNNLALMEAGCEELVPFNWVINILAVAAGVLFSSSVASTIWSAIFGWMYTSAVSSNPVINYCKAVNNRGAV